MCIRDRFYIVKGVKMILLFDMIDNSDDLSKFQQIYEKYKNTMYYVAYDVTKNTYDAEDVVQLSLIKLIDILYKIDKQDITKPRCKNLMITITKNTAIDFLRKSKHEPVPYEIIENPGICQSSEDIVIEAEDYHNLIQCINELEDKYRDVLRLRILHHLSAKEASKILNTSESNINTRLMRAKKILKDRLKEYDNNE